MAIGRTFAESLQKALRGLETGLTGLDEIAIPGADDAENGRAAVRRALGLPTPDRLRVIAQAFRHGLDVEEGGRGRARTTPGSACARSKLLVAEEQQLRRHGLSAEAERAAA